MSTEFTERRWKEGRPDAVLVKGQAFLPNNLPPTIEPVRVKSELYEVLSAAERNLGLLEGTARHLTNPHLLIGPFARREAVLSSAIENTFASAQEIALFEISESEVHERDRVREVYNYVRALNHGLESSLPVCRQLILDMHQILLQGVRREGVTPGLFRVTQNAIGREGASFAEAKFVPPPPDRIEDLIKNFEHYVNNSDDMPMLARMAIAHYQFETIHPFDDGNGRLGRLIIVLQLCKQRALSRPLVYISGHFERHRDEYYQRLYSVSTSGDWIGWIRYFVGAVATQAEDAIQRADRLDALRADFHERIRIKRASAILSRLVDELFRRPSITVTEASRITGINATPAGNAINRLVEKRILVEATGKKKDRIFIAPEILSIIQPE